MATEIRKITPQQAVNMLRKHGLEIDEAEAKKVLEIMYFLAKLIVNQNFKEK